MESPLLPLRLMARRLGVTAAWLKDEADSGRIPCLVAGGRYLFAPLAVDRSLSERASSPGVNTEAKQHNREAKKAKPTSNSVGLPSAAASLERPVSFEVIGNLSDEAIATLAALLLSVQEQRLKPSTPEPCAPLESPTSEVA